MGRPQGKMNLVFDTNVLVNAMVAELAPERASQFDRTDKMLVDWALANGHHLCFTQPTFMEFARVAFDMQGRTNMPPTMAFARKQYIDRLQSQAGRVEPRKVSIRSRDPDDQMILKAAAGAKADYLVSRDYKGILCLKRYDDCLFLKPEQFGTRVIGDEFRRFQEAEQALPADRNPQLKKASGPR